jgi:hypothetical protein
MRKFLTLCLLVYASMGCNSSADKTSGKDSTTNSGDAYAYTIKTPDNWGIGSSKNTHIALNALKAFEDNKIDESAAYFADTVYWKSDYMEAKLGKDSLKALLTVGRNEFSTIKITMEDFESVISKDKKDEWVTVWYKQVTTDKNGKTDSVAVVNDLKIENGKIARLDEALRHFKVKK